MQNEVMMHLEAILLSMHMSVISKFLKIDDFMEWPASTKLSSENLVEICREVVFI